MPNPLYKILNWDSRTCSALITIAGKASPAVSFQVRDGKAVEIASTGKVSKKLKTAFQLEFEDFYNNYITKNQKWPL